MKKKPASILTVTELQRSVAFYHDELGLVIERVSPDVAVLEPDSWPVLLAGPQADDVTPYLADVFESVKPSATIHRFSSDLDGLHQKLLGRNYAPVLHETLWGDRTLTIDDPDGYSVSFWTFPTRTTEQTIALYESGPGLLNDILAGVSYDDMDWKPCIDAWTIREIVHHIVDSDATALFRVKMALAEPGRVMLGNPYHPDTWASALDYAGRDVAPALALLHATRKHILQILHHLPNALDRSIQNPEGEITTVETFISMLASHLMIHIEQIEENQRLRSR